jgi:transcriptional regulator with XRE-family HTH domain
LRPHHDPRYQAFLKRLRAARVRSGLTQVQVAEVLGRTQTFISKCERGERMVNVLDVADFVQLYGVPLSALVQPRPGLSSALAQVASGRERRVAEPQVQPDAGKVGKAKNRARKSKPPVDR